MLRGSSSSTRPPGQARGQALAQDEYDPPLQLGAARAQTDRQGPSPTLESLDVPGRSAVRSCRGVLSLRRPDQRRTLPRLRHEVSNPDPQARRYCRGRQSRLAQSKAVQKAIRSAGARLLFLTKYSPDLNPIEQVFAKLKTLIRTAEPRTFDALSDALKTPPLNSLQATVQLSQKRRLRVHLNAEGSSPPSCAATRADR